MWLTDQDLLLCNNSQLQRSSLGGPVAWALPTGSNGSSRGMASGCAALATAGWQSPKRSGSGQAVLVAA